MLEFASGEAQAGPIDPSQTLVVQPNDIKFKPWQGLPAGSGEMAKLYGDFELRSEQGAYQPYRQVLASVVRQFGKELGFTPTLEEVLSLAGSLPTWQPWPDTVAALNAAGVEDAFTYVSTAGGAFLEWMEGKQLPGVAPLIC